MALAVVRDLRERRAPASPEEIAEFETDVLAGFVLARASAALADGTISSDIGHLEQVRAWFGKPLWDMEPADADIYFGQVLRDTPAHRPELEEALTHGPDPLHLAVVFDLDPKTAIRYADSARQLLQTSVECDPPG